jgi:hypothetical protein
MDNKHYFVPPKPFLERERAWCKGKTEKIIKKQETKKQSELEGCSFKPIIGKSSNQLNQSKYAENRVKKISGIKKGSYLQQFKMKT